MVEGDLLHRREKLRRVRLPLGIVLLLGEEFFRGLDPGLFARRGGVKPRPGGAGDDLPGPGLVLDVRHRHPPVGHDAGRVDLEDRPERSLRFPIPEAMELTYSLFEIALSLGRRRRDREADDAAARRERKPAPRPLGEALAVEGMAGGRRGGRRRGVVGCGGPGGGGQRTP